MKYKVFVEGQEGTTGLEIHQRLESRQELEVLRIKPDLRKEPEERRRLINQAVVSASLDNLGKGASGAAVLCMNIRLGLDEATGLRV